MRLAIVLVFAILGPPIALLTRLVLWASTGSGAAEMPPSWTATVGLIGLLTAYGAPLAYLSGSVQAIFTGLAACASYVKSGRQRIDLATVMVAATLSAGITAWETRSTRAGIPSGVSFDLKGIAIVLLTHLVPALACLLISQWLVRRSAKRALRKATLGQHLPSTSDGQPRRQ